MSCIIIPPEIVFYTDYTLGPSLLFRTWVALDAGPEHLRVSPPDGPGLTVVPATLRGVPGVVLLGMISDTPYFCRLGLI